MKAGAYKKIVETYVHSFKGMRLGSAAPQMVAVLECKHALIVVPWVTDKVTGENRYPRRVLCRACTLIRAERQATSARLKAAPVVAETPNLEAIIEARVSAALEKALERFTSPKGPGESE